MTDQTAPITARGNSVERGVVAAGTIASATALFSAAACCVLPLFLAGIGVGAGSLSAIVPYHRALTILAVAAVGIGWLLYVRKRRACARDASCGTAPPSSATAVMLGLATLFVALSAIWSGYLEQPLMRLLGGA